MIAVAGRGSPDRASDVAVGLPWLSAGWGLCPAVGLGEELALSLLAMPWQVS